VGFKQKKKKESDPYNVRNLFSLFLKNKINWKIVCFNQSFGEFVKGLFTNVKVTSPANTTCLRQIHITHSPAKLP